MIAPCARSWIAHVSPRKRGRAMIKVGIVGMGVIGTHLAKAIENGIAGIALSGVTVRSAVKAGAYPVFPLGELIARSDLVVEAATQAALKEFGASVLEAGK